MLGYLDESARDGLPTQLIGFTGGEPVMNRDIIGMLEDVLARLFDALVLANAMTPMRRLRAPPLALRDAYGTRLTIRVSLDRHTAQIREAERGRRSWVPTVEVLLWLARNRFAVDVAGRRLTGEADEQLRTGYAQLFRALDVAVDSFDRVHTVIFPEMDAGRDAPEFTEACWGILHKSPDDVMCRSSRMVVKRKGAAHPTILPCTLLAHDRQFEFGRTLAGATRAVSLNHPHCASFCVLGGAACSR